MPRGTNAPNDWPAEPVKWTRIVSSGRPSPPQRRVISWPSMVPTVRLTFRIGSASSTRFWRSIASRHFGMSVVRSRARASPWSWTLTPWRAHSSGMSGRRKVAGKSSTGAAQGRGAHDCAAGLRLASDRDDDPVAELVQDEDLLGLGDAELPGNATVLDRGEWRGPRAAVVAGDQDDVRVGLGDAGRDGADADFRDELHVDPRLWIGVLQVVDQLGQVLDRVDVVVRRRRDELHAGRREAHLRDPGGHLRTGERAALAGLGPLGHLDLEVVRVHEVLARHAEARGGDLLDRAPPGVAVRVAWVAGPVLAALARVRPAADPVHRDGEGLVGFLADRAG